MEGNYPDKVTNEMPLFLPHFRRISSTVLIPFIDCLIPSLCGPSFQKTKAQTHLLRD